MVAVAVVARYPAVRAGLRALLATAPGVEVVVEGSTPDALTFDQPVAVGVWSLGEGDVPLDLFAALPLGGAVFLADPPAAPAALASVDLPWAWLSRDADERELAAAVMAVAAGLISLDPAAARLLLRREPTPTLRPNGVIEEPLTPRESEVLQLMAEGLPNKAIARRLGITEHTVKFHVASVLGKLGAASRTEAVGHGVRAGLVVL